MLNKWLMGLSLAATLICVGLARTEERSAASNPVDAPLFTLEGGLDADTQLAHFYRRHYYRYSYRPFYGRSYYRPYYYGYSYPRYSFSYRYYTPYYSYRPYYGYGYPNYGYSYRYYAPRYYSYGRSFYGRFYFGRIGGECDDTTPLVTLAASCVPVPLCQPQYDNGPIPEIPQITPPQQAVPPAYPQAPAKDGSGAPSFRYDGGPANPVPMPQGQPAPKPATPKVQPLPGYLISLQGQRENTGSVYRAYGETKAPAAPATNPRPTSGFAFPAYGESTPRSSGFASDR